MSTEQQKVIFVNTARAIGAGREVSGWDSGDDCG